jgi:gluconate 2-dehydrogenase gamma chain
MSGEQPETRFDFTRRAFLEQSGFAGGAMILAGQAADVARGRTQQDASEGDAGVDEEALVQLDIDQARLVQAMAARVFPSDEFGPGAVELGVVYFIDRQLAGLSNGWGEGANWYMKGPFVTRFEGAIPNQGWQSNLVPQEAYEFALEWIEEYTNDRYGSSFVDLSPDQQVEVLTALENDEVDTFRSVKPSEFFTLFRTNVFEGAYCDPVYGGNRGMQGWRMKRFPGSPGALGSYKQLIGRERFIRIPPRSVEDDVESVGVETGAGSSGSSESSQGAVHNHDHGSRYELKGDGRNDEDRSGGHHSHESGGDEGGDADA